MPIWVKLSDRVPERPLRYGKTYVVITTDGADFGRMNFAGVWHDMEGNVIKVHYWLEQPDEV